ncbi:ATP-dependent RNA helicase dbp10 [Ophidiomyces ophidiicola]|uniref:ATP-dependent RNA helicase dbp10 n=1 Tax=Ophidiomyces ophidiicola TaxID=1387563 RepID=UPI0020C56AF7|nr:ATP-dependent RNA helicase dbp10 [Ophidiomyces ophidiicola]KAI1950500.1 ATP-dependent RNA helicase dbp10 [Ophidiomyces ophidiicola]KAI2058755.1 ATP-dependent RNA helicase dbp10 [Ophidiomyces ophidiicola]
MPRRAPSPAGSEQEFDIANTLFGNADTSDVETVPTKGKPSNLLSLDVMADGINDGNSEADEDAAFIAAHQAVANRKATNLKGRSVRKGGGFQVMGLNANLLKAITRKGFSVPTPIQRKTIPLLLEDQDVVAMARTGSGKTAAFVIPMIEKLKSHHSKVGSRALILSPSRELALQTMKVIKELGRGTDLKCVLLVGGDSLEEQFGYMASNPDIIVATPGRFLHLKVEMNLDLQSIKYVVFDEADRLFEMGFAAQLTEILHGLPQARQTLLFSATLPKSLVEFARAGLQEPTLVRLDTESKISPDLQNAFFSVKSAEKEGALLHILHEVIKVPTGETEAGKRARDQSDSAKGSKKRKRQEGISNPQESPTEHSTIIFVATKHHVDYISSLLRESGFAVSYAYGSLDQTARKMQVSNFRAGISTILVVTDVAARGIDIPVLANVINYDFPSQAKIFVHRVGRTARAGQKGWSCSLIRDSDAPYLLDLQLFLGRRLVLGRQGEDNLNYTEDMVVGSIPRDGLARNCEWVSKLLDEDIDIQGQRDVAMKGEKLYMRTRNSASSESAKRSKTVVSSDEWTMLHPLFNDAASHMEVQREKMLARIGGYKPQETIFEISGRRGGKAGDDEAIDTMRKIRSSMETKRAKKQKINQPDAGADTSSQFPPSPTFEDEDCDTAADMAKKDDAEMCMASDSELEVTFSYSSGKSKPKKEADGKGPGTFQNPEYFMSYKPTSHSLTEERAYGVHSGSNSNFVEASRDATMDLSRDEANRGFAEPRSIMRWDKRHKKYVSRRNDEDGSKGSLLVKGESGAKIAASFRSGRFEAWKKSKRLGRMPRVGETEDPSLASSGPAGGRRFRHKKEQSAKPADKYRGDYEKKRRKEQDLQQRQAETGMMQFGPKGGTKKVKSEIRSVDDVRKARHQKEKRREKNVRPSRRGKSR